MNIEKLINTIKECGDLTLKYQKDIEVELKEDGTKVTKADREVNEILQNLLKRECPTHGVMSEEKIQEYKEYTWYVDPIDGTSAYSRGEKYFNILVGLVRQEKPILGIIYNPPSKKLYLGGENLNPMMIDKDGTEHCISMAKPKSENLLFSYSYNPAKLSNYKYRKVRDISGDFKDLRIRIAQGEINIQIEDPEKDFVWGTWDICAGHAILNSLGGIVTSYYGDDIDYSKPTLQNGFIAADSIDRVNSLPWIER